MSWGCQEVIRSLVADNEDIEAIKDTQVAQFRVCGNDP
jgi:hypothetical protein